MSEVFVSYQRENLAAVGRLVEALRAEGIGVWWDQDIPPNAAWEATIEQALAAAKLVIVAWSPAAVASDNVKAEARWARGPGRLLQVFVEACEPPLFFGERQGVDLKGWSGGASAAAFRSLLTIVREGLSAAAPQGVARPEAPLALPTKPSIAVLPFVNLSGDPDQDYFADGMVEEITAALSRIRAIFVIASGSGQSFKGKNVGVQEIARQLGVRYVLEGSVRKAGGRIRIAVKLIDATDGAQIWTDRFEDTLEDVFALQDRVALSVAGRIEPAVTDAEMRRASHRPTENLGSYDLYLRAFPLVMSSGKTEITAALDLLNRAIALDPAYGAAMGAAAVCHYLFAIYGWSDDVDGHGRLAIELAHRALKATGDDAHVLGQASLPIADLEGDLDTAIALADRALDLNPGSAMAWAFSGTLRIRTGNADLAGEHLETSLRLDPLGSGRPTRLGLLASARFMQGRFAEAVALSKEYVQQAESPFGYAFLAASHARLGQNGAAAAALARYRSLTPQPLDVFAKRVLRHPAYVALFLDGVALAEGKSPTDAAP